MNAGFGFPLETRELLSLQILYHHTSLSQVWLVVSSDAICRSGIAQKCGSTRARVSFTRDATENATPLRPRQTIVINSFAFADARAQPLSLADFGQAYDGPLSRPLADPYLVSDLRPRAPLRTKRGNL